MQEALKPLMMGSSDALRGSQDNSTNTLDQTQSQDMNVSSKNTSMPSPPASFRVVCETENSVGLQSSITDNVCRICHCESEPDAPLISPCVCAGSLRYVHQECLQQWIKSADTKSCELCKFDFHMTTRVKPFRKWQRLEMSTVERRKVTCSVTFHVIAITCVIWSLYVLIDRTTTEIQAGKLEWPFWTKLVVVAIGFTGGLVFMYVQCKMYTQLCRQWKAYNRVIYIEDYPEKNNSKPSSPTVCADMPIDRQGGDKIALSALTSPPEPINKTMVLPSQRSNRSVQESELL